MRTRVKQTIYANSEITGNTSNDHRGSYEDIYANNEALETAGKNNATTTSGGRCYKLTAVFLGLLCVLLLAVILMLWFQLTVESEQLQIRCNNLTTERDQLQVRYNSLSIEREELQSRYNSLNKERERPLAACDAMEDITYIWKRTNSIIYYSMSAERKSWKESREDCKKKGADLVIVKDIEEQRFVHKYFGSSEAWIGLTDTDNEGTWKWVDGTELSLKFWWTGEPNNFGGHEDCVITGYKKAESDELTWADYPCNHPVVGICKRVCHPPQ